MKITDIQIEIARLPLPKVRGAFNAHRLPSEWVSKAEAVKWLAEQVIGGAILLDQIKNAPHAVEQPTATTVDLSGITIQIGSISQALGDQKKTTLQALHRADHVNDRLTLEIQTLDDRITQAHKETQRVLRDIAASAKPDTAAVQYEVARAVRDAFAPFAQAVKDAGAEPTVAQMASAAPVARKTAMEVFGIDVSDVQGAPLMVEVWDHPDAPAVDPDFIWTAQIIQYLCLAQNGDNLWFGGEKGTGKSETARQFAARTGRAFKRINFHKHTSAEEYVGSVGLVAGETVFQPKDFLMAYTCPSTVILLDEVTNADPGELAPLNGFLEPNAAVSFGGQTHRRAPGVLVFAADNTFGSGDDSGRHVGTRTQNSALIDRFAHVIAFTFLPAAKEIEAIVRRTGCAPAIAEHVLSAITVARQKVQSADIVDAPSIRSAMAFIRALRVLTPAEAWASAVVARQPSESHAELNAIFNACIDPSFINDNL